MKAKQDDPKGMDIATFMEKMKQQATAAREEKARMKQEQRNLREQMRQIKRSAAEYDRHHAADNGQTPNCH